MSISSLPADSISSLANTLFKRVDANSDGRLSTTEFQGFLESLVGKIGANQTQGLGTEAGAVATPTTLSSAATSGAAPQVYQPMLGFDYVKLNTLTHTTPKYAFARATQDVEMPFDRASRSTGLQKMVDNVKQNGYPDAKVVGDDCIDFGDGYGSIDVLTGDGVWWWGPKG